MFSQKTTTALLIAAVFALSYQTVALAQMSNKLEEASVGLGSSPTAVNYSSDGSAPQMVGGC